MVSISSKTEEGSPLLPSNGQRSSQRLWPWMVSLVAIAGVLAVVTVSSSSKTTLETYNLPDGVEPVDQLSFTQAEKIHEMGAKKLDDVASRDTLNEYFDKIGTEYHKEVEEQKKLRAGHHPGLLRHPTIIDAFVKNIKTLSATKPKAQRVEEDLAKEKAEVDDAVSKGLETPKKAKSVFSGFKVPSLKDAISGPVKQQKIEKEEAVETSEKAKSTAVTTKKASTTQLQGSKVSVEFYMESMCPGCQYFTTHVLSDLIKQPGFLSMVDLKVYPYGNGALSGTTIQCQHGKDECYGNKIIACMQSLYPVTPASSGFMPAFTCLESSQGTPAESAEGCASKNKLDYSLIKQCVESSQGDQLALAAAQATEALDPPHEYAPWLTLNGEPLRDKAYDLKEEVCSAYKGDKSGSLCDEAAKRSVAVQQLAAAPSHITKCYPSAAPTKRIAKPSLAATAAKHPHAAPPHRHPHVQTRAAAARHQAHRLAASHAAPHVHARAAPQAAK